MKEKAIRCPTGPAVIFLLISLGQFFTILSTFLMRVITDTPENISPLGTVRILLFGATALFMSIVLFSKKYNNLLLISTSTMLIPSISGLFLNITPYLICDMIFYLLLIGFTYVMVKMPETPIRERTAKFRFVIPVFQFVLILISTIQNMQSLYETLTETMGTQLSDAMNTAVILMPSILGAVSGFLPVLCYVWLVNWLANPYEK